MLHVGSYYWVIPGAAAIFERAGQARHATEVVMYVGPYLCVIPGAAAIIERAGQARHAAGIWGGVAVIISGVLGNLAHTLHYCNK